MKYDVHELLEVSRLFYTQGLSRIQISKRIGKYPMYITRLLNEAREKGLVRIEIKPPQLVSIQDKLMNRFKFLKKAIVTPSNNDFIFERMLCADAAARYFDEKVSSGMRRVAVGGGNTLYDTITALPYKQRVLEIYPTAMIGRGPTIETPDRAVIMSLLWAKSGGQRAKAYYASILPAENVSSIEQLQDEHELFLKRPIVKRVYNGMQRVECVFTGLGPVKSHPDYARLSPQSTLQRLIKMGVIPKDLKSAGAAGEVSYDFFDKDGNTRKEWRLALSIGVEQLKAMVRSGREVVVVAGRYREQALKAALKGCMLNVLITDDRTATMLLNKE